MGVGNGQPNLSVIVVTYNSSACIGGCLRSVAGSASLPAEIIVVDNNSADHTLDEVRRAAPAACVISNRTNRGFGAACNQGIARARGDYLLLLNPDAALYPDTAAALVAYLKDHGEVGIVGPQLVGDNGEPHADVSATARFPGFCQAVSEYTLLARTRWGAEMNRQYLCGDRDRSAVYPVAMVQGACFMFRKSVIDRIGGFDERFFLYFEETDFCRRAAGAGIEIHYVGAVKCLHLGGQSMPDGVQNPLHFFESLYRYHNKHDGLVSTEVLRVLVLSSLAVEYAAHRLVRRWRKPGDPAFGQYLEVLKNRFHSNLRLLFAR